MKSKKDLIHERDPTPERHENPLTIQFDAYEFLHHLEECDLTEEQKIEYLQTVWSIVLQFVDLGFGLHPIQQACGQNEDISLKPALTAPKRVYLGHPILCEAFENAGSSLCSQTIPSIHNEREEI